MNAGARSAFRHAINSPFEALVAFVLLTFGLAFLFGAAPPGSVGSQLPKWFQVSWGAYLAFGGSLTLTGLLGAFHRLFGAGLYLLAGGVTVYAVAVVSAPRVHGGGLPVGIDLAIGVACVLRARREAALWTRP